MRKVLIDRLYNCDKLQIERFNKINLKGEHGVEKLFDFSGELTKGICRKLKDLDYFKRFTIDPFTIDWNNEIGFAPEYLYEHGTPA